jgi:hypothetical protein
MEPLESRHHLSVVPWAVSTHEAHEAHLVHVAHVTHLAHLRHVNDAALAAAQSEAQLAAEVASSFEISMLDAAGSSDIGMLTAPQPSNVADLLESPIGATIAGSSVFAAA